MRTETMPAINVAFGSKLVILTGQKEVVVRFSMNKILFKPEESVDLQVPYKGAFFVGLIS